MKTFTFKIGGEAGFGIMSSGLMFAKVATRSGYHTFDYSEYPSIIRGGHNVMQVSISDNPVAAAFISTDFLVALNQETIDLHWNELGKNSMLLFDGEKCKTEKVSEGVDLFNVPLNKLAQEVGGSLLLRNTVALGATLALLGGDLKILKGLLAEEFKRKGEEVIKNNQNVCEAGYNYVMENFKEKTKDVLKVAPMANRGPAAAGKNKIVVTGNEAVALGAVAAGMQFAAIYPMTPITGILHTLAALQAKFDFIYKQPEDELAAINMAIGASFAGARAMTATAGGGFCLMTEGYGLAGIAEVPLVIIEGMRGSPATGMPTWTEQGDLRFVLHAHQGEFPKIILAAGDVNEAFHLTMKAFNLADKYQTPVVVMVDKNLCESHTSIQPFDYKNYEVDRGKLITKKEENHQQYLLSKDGVSSRSILGVGNLVKANSDEHDKEGYSSEEGANRMEQMEKRMQKLKTCAEKDMDEPEIFGSKDADLTIVSWGSNKGAILEALKNFNNVNYLHLTWVSPFPTDFVKKVLSKAKKILNVECNYSAQMGGLIKERTGIEITENLLKYDGRPFFPEELTEKFLKI